LLRGLDVRLVQLGLSESGVDIKADGIFGQTTSRCLKEYQSARGQAPTGVADPVLIAQLLA
jgi:chitosanase